MGLKMPQGKFIITILQEIFRYLYEEWMNCIFLCKFAYDEKNNTK